MRLTILVKEGSNGFLVGKIKEIPAVVTQGKDMNELKENIMDALELYFDDLREETSNDEDVITKEDLILA